MTLSPLPSLSFSAFHPLCSLPICAPLPSNFYKSEYASVSLYLDVIMSLSNWLRITYPIRGRHGNSRAITLLFLKCISYHSTYLLKKICYYYCNQLTRPYVIWPEDMLHQGTLHCPIPLASCSPTHPLVRRPCQLTPFRGRKQLETADQSARTWEPTIAVFQVLKVLNKWFQNQRTLPCNTFHRRA